MKNKILGVSFKVVLLLGLFTSCASQMVTLDTNPSSAEVYYQQEKIGVTPLKIDEAALKKYSQAGIVEFSLRKDGFDEKNFIFRPQGIESYVLNLQDLNPRVKKQIPTQYASSVNEITRELLTIQGLIFSKKTDEAKEKLKVLQDKYPYIASSYVLASSISLLKNDLKSAYEELAKAKSLDESDTMIKKMLSNVTLKIQEKSQGKSNE